MFKKVLAICSAVMLSLSLSGMPVNAATNNSDNPQELKYYNISELDTMPYENTYSYEELKNILNNSELNCFEVNRLLPEEDIKRTSSAVRYQLFQMKKVYYGAYVWQARFSVGLEYISGSDSPNRIVSLGGAHVYTGYGAAAYFQGSMYYKLQAGNSFYYNYYGNMYSGGYQLSSSIEIPIGAGATVTFTVSNPTNFIKNVSEYETYYSSGMQP